MADTRRRAKAQTALASPEAFRRYLMRARLKIVVGIVAVVAFLSISGFRVAAVAAGLVGVAVWVWAELFLFRRVQRARKPPTTFAPNRFLLQHQVMSHDGVAATQLANRNFSAFEEASNAADGLRVGAGGSATRQSILDTTTGKTWVRGPTGEWIRKGSA